jgi:hypothetical protein
MPNRQNRREITVFESLKLQLLSVCVPKLAVTAVFVFSFFMCGIAAETPKQANKSGEKIDSAEIKMQEKESRKKKNSDVSQLHGKERTTKGKEAESSLEKQLFIKKMKDLQNERRKVSLGIYQLRVKLIKENPDLQILQRSIMDMHRKMAAELNGNEAMKKMLLNAKKIDDQILKLINKNKK